MIALIFLAMMRNYLVIKSADKHTDNKFVQIAKWATYNGADDDQTIKSMLILWLMIS